MRNARQLREYIRRLEAAAFGLRNEAMLRNSPLAEAKILVFDRVIEEGRQADLQAVRADKQRQQAAKLALARASRDTPPADDTKPAGKAP